MKKNTKENLNSTVVKSISEIMPTVLIFAEIIFHLSDELQT